MEAAVLGAGFEYNNRKNNDDTSIRLHACPGTLKQQSSRENRQGRGGKGKGQEKVVVEEEEVVVIEKGDCCTVIARVVRRRKRRG